MEYPITPEYLENAPETIVRLYEDLEDRILKYICEQFKTGTLNATAIELIRLLQRRGLKLDDIEKYIKDTTSLSQGQLDSIYKDAIDRNKQYYDDTLTKQGLVGDTAHQEAIQKELDVIAEQTLGEFQNITRSLGFAVRGADGKTQFLPIADTYQRILDDAEMQVQSGAFSYNQAINTAVKKLTDSGLQWVDYETGHRNRIDVAARRAVMTGITQISAKYSDELADELDTPYIEVTAHKGARDKPGPTPWASHKAWQGKVYSKRAGDKYPSVYEVCGLGMVDGLCGANCRHHYHPFIDGISERTYTDEELTNIDPPPFDFEGRKYTAYEATQKQRQVETAMRKLKRDMVAYKAAGLNDEYTAASIKYKALDAEYKAFSKAARLPEQRQRINVANGTLNAPNASTSQKIALQTQKNRDILKEKIANSELSKTINDQKQARHIPGTDEFNDYLQKRIYKGQKPQSYLTIPTEEAQKLVDKYFGTGIVVITTTKGGTSYTEFCNADRIVGKFFIDNQFRDTNRFQIIYSKRNAHIFPVKPIEE